MKLQAILSEVESKYVQLEFVDAETVEAVRDWLFSQVKE
jgi:hypothetical protein